MHAPRFAIALHAVRVDVETDIDLRRTVGMDEAVPTGFTAIRYTATLTTDAPPERVEELIAFVERHSPTLDDLRRGLAVTGALVVRTPTAATS
jgi:hypothetical protein